MTFALITLARPSKFILETFLFARRFPNVVLITCLARCTTINYRFFFLFPFLQDCKFFALASVGTGIRGKTSRVVLAISLSVEQFLVLIAPVAQLRKKEKLPSWNRRNVSSKFSRAYTDLDIYTWFFCFIFLNLFTLFWIFFFN